MGWSLDSECRDIEYPASVVAGAIRALLTDIPADLEMQQVGLHLETYCEARDWHRQWPGYPRADLARSYFEAIVLATFDRSDAAKSREWEARAAFRRTFSEAA